MRVVVSWRHDLTSWQGVELEDTVGWTSLASSGISTHKDKKTSEELHVLWGGQGSGSWGAGWERGLPLLGHCVPKPWTSEGTG